LRSGPAADDGSDAYANDFSYDYAHTDVRPFANANGDPDADDITDSDENAYDHAHADDHADADIDHLTDADADTIASERIAGERGWFPHLRCDDDRRSSVLG
jgi:hypothetical protein